MVVYRDHRFPLRASRIKPASIEKPVNRIFISVIDIMVCRWVGVIPGPQVSIACFRIKAASIDKLMNRLFISFIDIMVCRGVGVILGPQVSIACLQDQTSVHR